MGSDKSTETPVVSPLSAARLKAALEAKRWRYRVDEDGEVSAAWDDGFFFFLLRGDDDEILHVRGTWDGVLTMDERMRARDVCDEWNRDMLWPKAYTVSFDDGDVRVCCELTVDYEFGVTDDQLAHHLSIAVGTGCSFFERVSEEFPEQAAARSE